MTVTLGDGPATPEELLRVAQGGEAVRLSPAALERLQAGRAVVERLAAGDHAIYGLTTGLGAAVDTRLAPEDVAAFGRRVILGRAIGTGAPLSREAVRAVLFARASGMVRGGSGISPTVAEGWVAMLSAGVHPVIPRGGNLGAADLATLSHATLPLTGLGEAEYRGEVLPGAEALRRAGLAPLELGLRDGHAILSHNAGSVGQGVLLLREAEVALGALDSALALGLEAMRANLAPLDPRCLAARPAPGLQAAAARLGRLLEGSALHDPAEARRLQDPLSFRSGAPVHGAVLMTLEHLREALRTELNAAAESPLLIAGEARMLSNSSFDLTALSVLLESLALALAHAASLSAWRVTKLLSASVTGLPRFLTPLGPSRAGFGPVGKVAASLDAEIRQLAMPCSMGTLAVADGVEDHATMVPLTLRQLTRQLAALRHLAATEMIVAAQALDLRGATPGPVLRRVLEDLRRLVPFLEEDRPMGPEIERLATFIAAGGLELGKSGGLASAAREGAVPA